MKFYVASSVKNKIQTRRLLQDLRSQNHDFTVDWTLEKTIATHERDANQAEVRAISLRDYEGIVNSDVFVLITEPSEGRSMYVELGIAIASRVSGKKPYVFVLGQKNDESIFYYHPAVKRVHDLAEILAICEEDAYKPDDEHIFKARIEEFKALRAEMVEMINGRSWGQATYAVIVGGLFLTKDSIGLEASLLLIMCLSIPLLLHTIQREDSRVRMANYLRICLEPKIKGMAWEKFLNLRRTDFGKSKGKGFLQPVQRLRHILALAGMYFGTSIFACVWIFRSSSTKLDKLTSSGLLVCIVGLGFYFYYIYGKGQADAIKLEAEAHNF